MSDSEDEIVAVEEEVEPGVERAPIVLDVLRLIKESQSTHGLRYGDYLRYRQYCSRRLRRIRKSVKFSTNRQKDKRFVKKEIPEDFGDEKFLLIPLVQAERAWSYAMQLREDNQEGSASKRRHLVRRLRKAVKHSQQFEELAGKRGTPRTALEAEAYHCWMVGNIRLEEEVWEEALEKFVRIRTVYEELQKVSKEADRELLQQRIDEVEPSIRYCTYNLQRKGKGAVVEGLEKASRELLDMRQSSSGAAFDMLKSKLESVLAETRKQQAETLSEIEWLGKTVAIKSDGVRSGLLAAKEGLYDLEKAREVKDRMDGFVKVLMAYSDATAALKASPDPFTRAYLDSLTLRTSIDRDLMLVEEYSARFHREESTLEGRPISPIDLVNLYDRLLSQTEELGRLPVCSENGAVQAEVAGRSLLFKAARTLWVAESYRVTQQWGEAVVLYERAHELAGTALRGLSESRVDRERCEALVSKAIGGQALVQSAAFESTSSQTKDATDSSTIDPAVVPLLSRLEIFETAPLTAAAAPKLVDFPPAMEAVPTKPVLFDLAFNSIAFPDISSRVAPKQKQSGGVLGWFRRPK